MEPFVSGLQPQLRYSAVVFGALWLTDLSVFGAVYVSPIFDKSSHDKWIFKFDKLGNNSCLGCKCMYIYNIYILPPMCVSLFYFLFHPSNTF